MAEVYPERKRQLQKLLDRLGLDAPASVKWGLLDVAMTHPTASATANYEQLEFIGDAVVRLFAAEWLWQDSATGRVGEWSAIRSVLVSDRTLAELAYLYGLERFLRVAPSAARDYKGQESRLADAFEAMVGALYLSTHDFSLIRPWLEPHFEKRAAAVRSDPAYQNYKAALQQWTQAHYQQLPEYRVHEAERPELSQDHLNPQRFIAEVWLLGEHLATGVGRSRKAAEKSAAEAAFLKLQAQPASLPKTEG
ncbi:ribonuclease III [Synechococcales cyanobacterium C]|uniref:Ribonuclease 3 n=1 Tax=Petrachloros mirabilis ULC683 TaxID=2781853 RepID=A0A8K1ZXC7_9CYAN|nr:ribonuclease III [Petrachloros mirabilis]NCJ07020.1 ribonuclease III [Petrachloros mirabilis ULC683]